MSAIARSALPRRATILRLALALLPVLALIPVVHAQAPSKRGEMCWPAEALKSKDGEERIQRASVSIAPPERRPIDAEPIPPANRYPIRRVKLRPGLKLVALTFDLCEQPYEVAGYQGGIVDYLREHKIRATFFAGGKWMLTHKDRAQQLMTDPLFEIGNHTWEHQNLRLLNGSALLKEIERPQTAYEQVREELAARRCLAPDGRRPAHQLSARRLSLFRFPFGACNAQALDAVGGMGLQAIQWDVSSGDPWVGQKPELMVKAVRAGVKPGSIILFHANGRGWHTTSALPAIVEELKAQGYRFATVSELLASGVPEYSETCYDSRPGDTDRYDKLAQRLSWLYERWRSKVLSVPSPVLSKKRPVATEAEPWTEFKTETREAR